jgi:hypothetical protein
MRLAVVLAAFAISLTVACSQSASPTSPSIVPVTTLPSGTVASPATQVRAGAAVEVQFKGSIEGVYQGFGAPPLVTVHVEAEGHATHLGRFELDSVHVVNFVDLTGAGTASLVAANGDRITAGLTGRAMPIDSANTFFIVERLTITGGTGRFEGATGTIDIERTSVANGPDAGTTTGSMTGTLVLPRGGH